jgi:hypothetical protein
LLKTWSSEMNGNATRVVRFGAGLMGLTAVAWLLSGQDAKPAQQGFPTDWSHRHLIFSRPATVEQARRIALDPRHRQQGYRENAARVVSSEVDAPGEAGSWSSRYPAGKMHRDWAEDLGPLASVGAVNFPAKFSFGISTANCGNATTPDYVVYNTGLAGTGSQASIVAYDNLYSGCTGSVPSIYWAYNTGGTVLTSPVLSGDGSQVAFMQTAGGHGSLVVLKWHAGDGSVGSPIAPFYVAPSLYSACAAPCMTQVPIHDNANNPVDDTTSSVYYDYDHDIGWTGGALGWLHKITGVFQGTPTEVTTGGFPVQVRSATSTSSPVFDQGSGNVFVGDSGGSAGYLYRVSASTGTVTASAQLDFAVGVVAGPIVDSTAGKVYVFASNDGSTNCAGAPCAAVYQFATNFTGGTTGPEVTVGTSSAAPNPLYDGTFDAAYRSSPVRTGNLYVCGDTGLNPILYRVPITTGNFGTAVSVAAVTAAANHRICSPVTDILNPNATGGPAERVFFSVQNSAHPTICATAGCALSFVDLPWQASTTYKVGQEILVYRPNNNTLYINVATNAAPGTSGATPPTPWPAPVGTVTFDGTVTWLNQGATTLTALANWAAGHLYAARARIVVTVSNVNYVQIVQTGGTSGGSAPAWATTAGATTTDNGVTWVNAGVLPSSALRSAGGASGMIIDNVVPSGTLGGASEVYFGTLANQVCTTSGGTGGCAVQATQSGLN